jgi:hypothetical protein
MVINSSSRASESALAAADGIFKDQACRANEMVDHFMLRPDLIHPLAPLVGRGAYVIGCIPSLPVLQIDAAAEKTPDFKIIYDNRAPVAKVHRSEGPRRNGVNTSRKAECYEEEGPIINGYEQLPLLACSVKPIRKPTGHGHPDSCALRGSACESITLQNLGTSPTFL